MKKVIKQCVGIDCAKDELVVCFGQLSQELEIVHKATEVFANTSDGFKKLGKWAEKMADREVPVCFVVEATGVYHQKLTHYLFDAGKPISVALPNRARYFAKTLKVRTVNDKESSKMLATLGLEKKLDAWEKPDPVFDHLKRLTREREHLLNAKTMNKNILHAEEYAALSVKNTIKRLKQAIRLQDKQIKEIEQEITSIIEMHPGLQQKIKKICTIPGVGLMTVVTLVAECNGFNLIRNSKQLVSYAGYDVVEKQSGTSVQGKSHISGHGNKHIRKALHFPAITNVKYDAHHQGLYKRLEAKHGIKMKAYTAVQRKLLVLIYTLWKKDECYNPACHQERHSLKILEQPIGVALTELDHVRSLDFDNLNTKLNNNFQLISKISKT
jgi:transposase